MRDKSKYQMLANILKTEIMQNTLPEGTKLMTEMQLTKKYEVSRQTVRQAFQVLESEGLIYSIQGSGTYVTMGIGLPKFTEKTIGVICSYITEYIFPSIIRGIEEVVEDKGYSISLSSTRNRVDNERLKLEYYLRNPVNGLIVEGSKTALPNPNINLYEELAAKGTKIVYIHATYDQLINPVYVIVDDYAGGLQAVEHLLSHGHKHIAGIFKSDDKQGVQRCSGFMDGLTKAGQTVNDDGILWFNDSNREAIKDCDQLKSIIDRYSAIVCYNDKIAIDVMEKIHEMGKKVPDNISIISFDDSLYAKITSVSLTSLAHPKELLGKVAAQKILNMIEGTPEISKTFNWKLVERNSVKPI